MGNNRFINKSSDNIVRSPIPDVMIPNETVPEFVWRNMEKFADYPALTCATTGRSYTYKEARILSRKFGSALVEKKFKPGEVLAIMLPNMPEFPLVLLGALEAGMVVTTINSVFKTSEIMYGLKATAAKTIVTLPSLVPTTLKEVFQQLEISIPIITVSYDEPKITNEGSYDFDDMISDDIKSLSSKTSPDDIALLVFSSGTTGPSKTVPKTHRNLVASTAETLAVPINYFKETTSEHQDVVPMTPPLPLVHSYGLATALRGLSHGVHLMTLPTWDPQTYLNVVSNQKPLSVVCHTNPFMVLELCSFAKTEDLGSVRIVVNGAGQIVPSHVENFLAKMPNRKDVKYFNRYGSAETMLMTAPLLDDSSLETVGCPLPNTEIRLVDSSGRNVGVHQEGEVYVRGPQVIKGYLDDDKANAEGFDDGWFKTGDMAYYDESGRFYLVGRSKELIKIGGYSISPVDLETVLLSHPHVADAAVVGVPDDRTEERPIAFVVPKPHVQLDCDNVSEFVAQHVASYKRLKHIFVRDSLPRNPIGKILRSSLKEQYLKSI